MRHVKLKIRYDQETGTFGFAVNGLDIQDDIFIASEGRLIAHDIIEHQNGAHNIGSVGDELEALGAIWYVRGEFSDISRDRPSYYSPEDNITSDIVQIYRNYMSEGFNWPQRNTREHEYDDIFFYMLNKAREDIPQEYDLDHYAPDTTEEQAREMIEEYLSGAIHYLRTGARKAHKRFKKVSKENAQVCANTLFWNIAEAIDEKKQYMSEEFQGLEFRLSYSVDFAECVPLWDDDDERQFYI